MDKKNKSYIVRSNRKITEQNSQQWKYDDDGKGNVNIVDTRWHDVHEHCNSDINISVVMADHVDGDESFVNDKSTNESCLVLFCFANGNPSAKGSSYELGFSSGWVF